MRQSIYSFDLCLFLIALRFFTYRALASSFDRLPSFFQASLGGGCGKEMMMVMVMVMVMVNVIEMMMGGGWW